MLLLYIYSIYGVYKFICLNLESLDSEILQTQIKYLSAIFIAIDMSKEFTSPIDIFNQIK